MQRTGSGFRVEDVQTFRTALLFPRYTETVRRAVFYRRVLGDVRQLPGVTQASYISFLPMTMRGGYPGRRARRSDCHRRDHGPHGEPPLR